MKDPEAELNAKYPERAALKEIIKRCGCDKAGARRSALSWLPYEDEKHLDLVLDTIDLYKIKNAFDVDTQADVPDAVTITFSGKDNPGSPNDPAHAQTANQVEEDIGFTVEEEPWNRHELSDGTALKTRLVLEKVKKIPSGKNRCDYKIFATPVKTLHVNSKLDGAPDKTEWTRKDMINAIECHDLSVNTIDGKFNRYHLGDGAKVRIYTKIVEISRTRLYDKKGSRIYLTNIDLVVDVDAPEILPTLENF